MALHTLYLEGLEALQSGSIILFRQWERSAKKKIEQLKNQKGR
jgi:hypothetical protein